MIVLGPEEPVVAALLRQASWIPLKKPIDTKKKI
jgi:hypothetical protein